MDAVESLDFGNMCYIDDEVTSYFDGFLPAYVVENGDASTTKERFVKMLAVANDASSSEYISVVGKELNLRDFMTYQALNVALLNFDSYIGFNGNQIYIYDTLQSKWQVTPWDFNASFGLWDTNNHNIESYPYLPSAITNGCIASNISTVPELRSYYLEAMCQIHSIWEDSESYYSQIDFFADQIRDAVYTDTRKVISNDEFERGLEFGYQSIFFEDIPGLKELVAVRNKVIEEGLTAANYFCSVSTEVQAAAKFNLYPNPASEILHINASNLAPLSTYQVHDSKGILYDLGTLQQNQIEIDALPSGLYFLSIYVEGEIFVSKFMKL